VLPADACFIENCYYLAQRYFSSADCNKYQCNLEVSTYTFVDA